MNEDNVFYVDGKKIHHTGNAVDGIHTNVINDFEIGYVLDSETKIMEVSPEEETTNFVSNSPTNINTPCLFRID